MNTQGLCNKSTIRPTAEAIQLVLDHAKKAPQKRNMIVIARNTFLVRKNVFHDSTMVSCCLCITIKEGKIRRAFYVNEFKHLFKKLNYYFQILN